MSSSLSLCALHVGMLCSSVNYAPHRVHAHPSTAPPFPSLPRTRTRDAPKAFQLRLEGLRRERDLVGDLDHRRVHVRGEGGVGGGLREPPQLLLQHRLPLPGVPVVLVAHEVEEGGGIPEVTAVEEDLRDRVTPRQGVALGGDAPCGAISARACVCVCVCECSCGGMKRSIGGGGGVGRGGGGGMGRRSTKRRVRRDGENAPT